MEKDSGMAIPTMFNCSARILVGRGGSILCSPREEACVRATEKHQVPLVLPELFFYPGMDSSLAWEMSF
ncbi:hypothetical protein AALO_G00087050 [Alosa alosa]|uniref:Uncharacterized protein n=1 Tax=Alosa alosa TaxID=278164 RepID=A0AAV6H0V4_9TELE|nr:hypothetical protein AALO_G00087050 [Alosa alosa]